MYGRMLRLVLSHLFFIEIGSIGLKEEFSWTRLSYQWPSGSDLASRGSFGNSYGRPGGYEGSIVFEDYPSAGSSVNREVHRGGSYGGNRGNGGSRPSGGVSGNNGAPQGIDYQYENNIPMGANVYKDKMFITVPRRRQGVPSSLNYIPLNSEIRHNVPLIPYPNWEHNLHPNRNGRGIVSVYRVAVDTQCDRLWFVDTGVIEIPGNITRIQPQALVAIDLKTDRILGRFELPQDIVPATSFLAFTAIDVTKDTCDDAYVYIPDLAAYSLYVFSLRESRFWRVNHNYFHLEPLYGDFDIAGHRFQWTDGIFSVELTDIKPNGYRDLYFHAMAGIHIYKVSTRILRNETLATRSFHENDFQVVGHRPDQYQSAPADIHKSTSTMFLGLINKNAVGCWNVNTDIKDLSIVQEDDKRMIYPADVKVHEDRVYVLTNTMPEFLFGRLNYDEVNFRVWSNTVREAIAGTKCEASGRGGSERRRYRY